MFCELLFENKTIDYSWNGVVDVMKYESRICLFEHSVLSVSRMNGDKVDVLDKIRHMKKPSFPVGNDGLLSSGGKAFRQNIQMILESQSR
jgi:hypothetical protein